jgi:NAD-dependent DNA ligase
MKLSVKVVRQLDDYPKESLAQFKEEVVREVLDRADTAYHEKGEPILSDASYDVLREHYPRSTVGAPVTAGSKVSLPYWMGSMDKRRTSNVTDPVVISDKLDGVSALLMIREKVPVLYTRGNGAIGRDITHLTPHLSLKLPKKDCVVRGELIMSRKQFAALEGSASNARNTVSGFVNSSKGDVKALSKKVDFVAYEVMEPSSMTPHQQLVFARDTLKLQVARFELRSEGADAEFLREEFLRREANSEYEMDGLIVARDVSYEPVTKGNPKHAFAFKLDVGEQDHADTSVREIVWKASKDSYLKPVIHLEPVHLKGVRIARVSGKNARYVVDAGIGIGARVRVVRSGDVIPHIVAVLRKASPSMPSVQYTWNSTNVDIVVKDDQKEAKRRAVVNTLVKLKVPSLAERTIEALYDAGHTTVGDVFDLSAKDIESIERFGKTSAEKLVKALRERRAKLTCLDFAVASNLFGRGVSTVTLRAIDALYPLMRATPTKEQLVAINGIGPVGADAYLKGHPEFLKFVRENRLGDVCNAAVVPAPEQTVAADGRSAVRGKVVVFTGFRDKELADRIEALGGKVASTVVASTTTLVHADNGRIGEKKLNDARKKGIEIMPRSQLESLL